MLPLTIAGLLLFAGTTQQIDPNASRKNPGAQEGHAQSQRREEAAKPQPPSTAIQKCSSVSIQQPDASRQQNEPYNARHDTLYRAYLWFTIIGVIVALAGLCLVWVQSNTAKNVAESAKESAIIALNAQRSWIIADGVTEADINTTWFVRATCAFKVYGKSPIRVTEAHIKFHSTAAKDCGGSRKEPDLPTIPNYGDTPITLEELPQMGKLMPPGDEFFVIPKLEQLFLTAEQEKAIKNRELFLVIYGVIKYRDAFAKALLRETRFCYEYGVRDFLEQGGDRPLKFMVGGPPAYNEAT